MAHAGWFPVYMYIVDREVVCIRRSTPAYTAVLAERDFKREFGLEGHFRQFDNLDEFYGFCLALRNDEQPRKTVVWCFEVAQGGQLL